MNENGTNAPDDDGDFDFDQAGSPLRLSESGERRRGEMLSLLTGAVTRRRRRHVAVRAGAVAAATVLAAVAAWRVARGPEPREESPSVARSASAPPEFVHARIESVTTDPAILAIANIGDEELLEALSATGRSTGLVRYGERAVLTGRVVDDSSEKTPVGAAYGDGRGF